MSDISITQHIDAFRNLARRHLEKGSVDGLAALKQTLEMDDKTFAELLKPPARLGNASHSTTETADKSN